MVILKQIPDKANLAAWVVVRKYLITRLANSQPGASSTRWLFKLILIPQGTGPPSVVRVSTRERPLAIRYRPALKRRGEV
jgi:hypothetical protein